MTLVVTLSTEGGVVANTEGYPNNLFWAANDNLSNISFVLPKITIFRPFFLQKITFSEPFSFYERNKFQNFREVFHYTTVQTSGCKETLIDTKGQALQNRNSEELGVSPWKNIEG